MKKLPTLEKLAEKARKLLIEEGGRKKLFEYLSKFPASYLRDVQSSEYRWITGAARMSSA